MLLRGFIEQFHSFCVDGICNLCVDGICNPINFDYQDLQSGIIMNVLPD
jgi:hypothetical protein